METITQDRYEDILFENILFFIAEHELAYVSECRKMALWWGKTLGSGWGASTGRWMTRLVPVLQNWDYRFLLALGDLLSSWRQLVQDLGWVQKA